MAVQGRQAPHVAIKQTCVPYLAWKIHTMYSSLDNVIGTAYLILWNKDRMIDLKRPSKHREIWAVRVRLKMARRTRDLAPFILVIDSKLRACNIVKLQVRDAAHSGTAVS